MSEAQSHIHQQEKSKTVSIKFDEGHGIDNGIKEGPELKNVPICRFNFPKFPNDEATFIFGVSKDLDKNILDSRREDLRKITKYLIRQTLCDFNLEESEKWKTLKQMTFLEILYKVGMFKERKPLSHIQKKR